MKNVSNDEAHRIMLDATLTATHRARLESFGRRSNTQGSAAGPGGDVNHMGYSKAIWSRKGAMEGDMCLLCLVTYDHQIKLVVQTGIRWASVFDLGSLWYQYSSTRGKKILKQYAATIGEKKHHLFIAQTKFLGVAEITWTENSFSDEEIFSFLILVTTSSHLAVIKIPQYKKNVKFEPSVLDCFPLDDLSGKVSALHWFGEEGKRGFVSVATVKGNVEVYSLSLAEDNVSLKRIIKLENNLSGMSVNGIELICVDTAAKTYILYVCKHNILFAYLLSMDPSGANVIASTHMLLGCFAISGLNIINSTLLYVCVKDAKILKLEVDVDSSSISFRDKEAVFSSDGVLYNGFCSSPNKTFLGILECVSVPYDHLLMREPSVVSLFQVNSFSTVMKHILIDTSQTLAEQVDVFESLRLHTYRGDHLSFPSVSLKDISSMSSYLKRVHLWTMIIELGTSPRDGQPNDKETKEKLRDALEESIFTDYAVEILTACTSEGLPTHSLHRQSLFLMYAFLQRTKCNQSLVKVIKNYFKKQNFKGEERCLVCGSAVEFSHIKTARCSQGHSMPRCLRSLVATVPILRCIHCHLFYHPQATQWYGEEASKCLICFRRLLYRVKGRNLSLLNSSSNTEIEKNLVSLKKEGK